RSTRRSELPRVIPKPRSSGSATKTARRRASPAPCLRSSAFGFFSSCQFFALTAIFLPCLGGGSGVPPEKFQLPPDHNPATEATLLDAAPLRRPHAVVRDRGHVADRGDRET